MKSALSVVAIAAAVLAAAGGGNASAADRVWKGEFAGRWSNAVNWEGGVVPEAGDRVILRGSRFVNPSAFDLTVPLEALILDGSAPRSHSIFLETDLILTGAQPVQVVGEESSLLIGCAGEASRATCGKLALTDVAPRISVLGTVRLFQGSFFRVIDGVQLELSGDALEVVGTGFSTVSLGTLASANRVDISVDGPDFSMAPLPGVVGNLRFRGKRIFHVRDATTLGDATSGTLQEGGTLWFDMSASGGYAVDEALDLRSPERYRPITGDLPYPQVVVNMLTCEGACPSDVSILRLTGPIRLTSAQEFHILRGAVHFDGPIGGTGALFLTSSAARIGNPSNTFSGGVLLERNALTLGADEVIPDANAVTMIANARLSIGSRTETIRALDCSGSRMSISAGQGLLRVLEASRLRGCGLDLSLPSSAPNASITLIRNDSNAVIDGQFGNLPEGSIVTIAGEPFTLTYSGNASGRDVVLVAPQRASREFRASSPMGNGSLEMILEGGGPRCAISSAEILHPAAASIALPQGAVFPYGLVRVLTQDCSPGSAVRLRIATPAPVSSDMFIQFMPGAGTVAPAWTAVPFERNGSSIVVEIGEGGLVGMALPFKTAQGINFTDLWWSGLAENGWGLSLVQHGDTLFTVIYAYGTNGAPSWYVMSGGAWNAERTAYTGALYAPTGSPFHAYDASRLNVGAPVGTLTITFTDASHATLTYTINGVAGRKDISRQRFGPPLGANLPIHADMWWGGTAQNGWGVAVLQQFSTLFAIWFTYDDAGQPTWLLMPAGSWTTADVYEGRIYRTQGSPWLGRTYNPLALRVTDVGSFRIRFEGDTATLEYVIDGRSGTLPLSRQPF